MTYKKTYLGLVYVIRQMLEQDLLSYDPNDHNRMLIYRKKGSENAKGWYSENILETVSELFANSEDMDTVLSCATENGIDIEQCFMKGYRATLHMERSCENSAGGLVMKDKTKQQLEECYEHINPYISKEHTPELFQMCENCKEFHQDVHDFASCKDKPCFQMWLAFEYLEWSNSFS